MKKGIITILILMLSTASVFAQLQGFGTYRIANATTPLGLNIAKGSAIFNINTDDIFILKKNENSTATLSGMVLGTDYINLQLWEGHKFADYLDQPVLISSSPTFNGLTIQTGIYTFGIDEARSFISNVTAGTQPYSTNSTTLNTNLNADLLDGQHGSYYRSYNNLTDKEYIGLQHITAETDTLSKGVFLQYKHFSSSDTTFISGLISLNSSGNAIIINSTGNYKIIFSFQFSNSESEPFLKFQIANGSTILTERDIATTSGENNTITIMTTSHLTGGAFISLQYTCTLAIAEYLTISNMNVYIEKK